MVYPSGGALAMCWAAMLPPAPALFSTTTGCPTFSPSFCAMSRAAVSAPPPGAKPTVNVTVRLGKFCPPTTPATVIAAIARIIRTVDCIRILPRTSSPVRRSFLAGTLRDNLLHAPSLAHVCRGFDSARGRTRKEFSRQYDVFVVGTLPCGRLSLGPSRDAVDLDQRVAREPSH